MKKEEIYLSDWYRWVFGNTPMEFMLEIFIRTIIVYFALLIAMRLLGKRMNGQLTIMEFAIMLTLGAIVAVPFQIAERGIVPSLLVLVVGLVFHRGLNWLSFKYRKVEKVSQGEMRVLVYNGVIDRDALTSNRISKEQLFAQLRDKSIRHLGQVKRVYMEACGLFSVFTEDEEKPGLSVLPERDKDLLRLEPVEDSMKACNECGYIVPKEESRQTACSNCSCETWVNAIK